MTVTLHLLWGIFVVNPVYNWHYLYCSKVEEAPVQGPTRLNSTLYHTKKLWTSQWCTSKTCFMCCDVTNQHTDIIERGSLFPLFYYLYTFHTFRALSSEIQRCCVVIEWRLPLFLSLNRIPTHRRFRWMLSAAWITLSFSEGKKYSLIAEPGMDGRRSGVGE